MLTDRALETLLTNMILPVPVPSPDFGIKNLPNSGFLIIGFISQGNVAISRAIGAMSWNACIKPPTSRPSRTKPIACPKAMWETMS